MVRTYTTNNEMEQMQLECVAYKRKSDIDDLLRQFGADIEVYISRTINTKGKYNPPSSIVITPNGLWKKMNEFGFSDGENELYEIYVDILEDFDKEDLITRVKTMIEVYKNSIFSIASKNEDDGLYQEIFYDESKEEYLYIVEDTVIVFNEDMQQVGTATVDNIDYDSDDNITSVTYHDYEPTKHYTYVYNKQTFSGKWQ